MNAPASLPGSPTTTAPRRRPASASWAVSRLIRGSERRLQVVARFPQAAYLVSGEDLVALVTSDGIRHPNAVVLDVASGRRPLAGLAVDRPGRIGDGGLSIGGLDLRVVRWWDPRPRLRTSIAADLRAASDVTRRRLRQLDGPVSATHDAVLTRSLATVVESLVIGDEVAALDAAGCCIGLGPGLTPSGDDRLAGLIAGTLVLAPSLVPAGGLAPAPTDPAFTPSPEPAGVVATVERFGRAVSAAAAGRTTSVSVALLGHAALGQLAAPAAELVRAWTSAPGFRVGSCRPEPQDPTQNGRNTQNSRRGRGGDAERAIVRATDGLLAVGSSSGRDLTLGLLAAVQLLTDDRVGTVGPSPRRRSDDPRRLTDDPRRLTDDPRRRSDDPRRRSDERTS